MPVFRNYFTLIRRHIASLALYLFIFCGVVLLITAFYQDPSPSFTQIKPDIALVNKDSDDTLSSGLKHYMAKKTNIIENLDTKEKQQDAMYYEIIQYAITIPKGFGEQVRSGESPTLERYRSSTNASYAVIDIMVNEYVSSWMNYKNLGYGDDKISAMVAKDLDDKISATVDGSQKDDRVNSYFNYLAYGFLTVIFLGISTVSLILNKKEIRMRNLCSPISNFSMQYQISLGNIIFAFITWIIFMIPAFALYPSQMLSVQGAMYVINSIVLLFPVLGICFLASYIVNSAEVQSAICNVVTLGLCFISGIFVPQAFLGEGVLAAARFTPTYWLVKANEYVSLSPTLEDLFETPYLMTLGIMLLFAAAFFALTLLIGKHRRTIA